MANEFWMILRVGCVLLVLAAFCWAAFAMKHPFKKPFLRAAIVVSLLPVVGCAVILFGKSTLIAGLTILMLSPFVCGLFFIVLFHFLALKQPCDVSGHPRGSFGLFALLLPALLASVQLLLLFSLLLEGIICLLMAAPFWIGLTVLGSMTGWVIIWMVKKVTSKMLFSSALLVLSPFMLQSLEAHHARQIEYGQVTSVVEINAPPQTVFDRVVAFPRIPDALSPSGLWDGWFSLGLPKPVQATVACRAVNCLRKCHFTQNTLFNERITRYEPARELSFDVEAQVGPQNLITGVDPHVMPGGIYFETTQGRFQLQPTANGHTILRGTSWYRLHSSINWYARPWAETFLHLIHNRVLQHVKVLSETTS
ncbi:MAG: hypothetical protein VKK59_02070 [Vampirovibrionales bacterium]|nr:hypothetical protein [Vampirovibrionales bacterium]